MLIGTGPYELVEWSENETFQTSTNYHHRFGCDKANLRSTPSGCAHADGQQPTSRPMIWGPRRAASMAG